MKRQMNRKGSAALQNGPSQLAACAALALALAGCTHNKEPEMTGSIAADYRMRHPIAIAEKDRSVEIFVGNGRGSLTAPQQTDVMAFAGAWSQEATGGVLVDMPQNAPNSRAAAEVWKEVRSLLGAAGIPARSIQVRPYTPIGAQLATIRLNYPKMTATAGPCGDWPEDLGPTYASPIYMNNRTWTNFGCSSQRNLAAMVDNPADLVQPRPEAPSYTGRRSTVLDKYRKGEPTAVVYPDANAAKVSDVAK